jgi:FtsP/CotA-like multicopper oxidase with cupredoxin domain
LRLNAQQMQLLGLDSGRFRAPGTVEELLLAPGNRADILVTAAARDSTFTSVFYDRGGMPGMAGRAGRSPSGGQGQGKIPLATLSVSGEPADPPPAVPARQEPADLRTSVVAARRQLTFAAGGMGMGGMSFTINGGEFNETRTDTTAAGQTVEEWTLKSSSPMDHPFHLHVQPIEIVEDRGKTPRSPSGKTSSTYLPTDRSKSGSPSKNSQCVASTTATSWTTRTME